MLNIINPSLGETPHLRTIAGTILEGTIYLPYYYDLIMRSGNHQVNFIGHGHFRVKLNLLEQTIFMSSTHEFHYIYSTL